MNLSNNFDLDAVARRVMRAYEFRVDFPADAMNQSALAAEPSFNGKSGRDLTSWLWSSIDNDDSRDLDQLETIQPDAKGLRLYVAVANVDNFAPSGSAIDKTAEQNTTSIYTGVETFALLPKRLSNDLSSLLENKKRLAVVMEMLIDADGKMLESFVYPAVVENKAQLTYDGVALSILLENKSGTPMSGLTSLVSEKIQLNKALQIQIQLQNKLAQALEKHRHNAGALTFAKSEFRPVISPNGSVQLTVHFENQATLLIENFMIAANQATVIFLEGKGYPSLHRIVRTPKRWDRIVQLAKSHGFKLPDQPEVKALQEFLTQQQDKDPDHFADISLSIIKLLGRGEYVVQQPGEIPIGHFGLAVENYSHSTAPNRRYPDILTQRLVLAAESGKGIPYSSEALRSFAQHCTNKEDDANKVERSVRKSIAAVAMSHRIGEKFSGIITGSSEKGIWVRVTNPPVEGKLEGNIHHLDVGDRVLVRLSGTNPERGFINFQLMNSAN